MRVICNGHKTCITWKLGIGCKHRVAHEFCDTDDHACEADGMFKYCVCESINKERKEKLEKIKFNQDE